MDPNMFDDLWTFIKVGFVILFILGVLIGGGIVWLVLQ